MSAPTPRPNVADIPAYVPGRPPEPREGRPTYKLSSNENPAAPHPAVLEAVTAAAADLNRYPDMGCTALYAALAERLGVPVDHLAAGTGSVAVLYHLLQAYCGAGDEVVYAWRSFEAYPIAVQVTGATSVPVPLGPGSRHDLDGMAAAVGPQTRVVVLCTPNNPTGPSLTHAEVAAFVARVPDDVLVVVDEAYREFVRSHDPVDGVALHHAHPNVVVLRTFAKAYGLAGLRVGYLVADPVVVTAVRACALPFGVSAVAQAAAVAALAVEPDLLAGVDEIVAERVRVRDRLLQQGWDVPDAQGNFVWLTLGARTVDFARAAEGEGVMVRPFAGDGARVSIGESAANDLFLELAAAFAS